MAARVTPGFRDAHVHPPMAGLARIRCELHGACGVSTSTSHRRRVRRRQPGRGSGSWAADGRWRTSRAALRREDLDRVVPDRPVFLPNRDGHDAWVNSRALELAGMDDDTPDPPRGRIERRADGTIQGTLHEGASDVVWDVLPQPDPEEWLEAARIGQRVLHGYEITAWQDASGYENDLSAYRRLAEAGELTGRVIAAQRWSRHDGLEQLDALVDRRRSLAIGRLRADRLKILLDGIVENFTAAMLEPYLDADGRPTENRGMYYFDLAVVREAVRLADAAGMHVHIHAIGDRAVREALDAIEAAIAVNASLGSPPDAGPHPGRSPCRHPALRVARRGRQRPALLGRPRGSDDRPHDASPRARGRAWQYPFASLLRAGARLAFGSDWSVSTADPLQEIEVAVRRVSPDHREMEPFPTSGSR